MEHTLAVGITDKSPSNPNSPVLNRANKTFYKFGAKRHKHESSQSESTDPLLLSYKSNDGEALPEEGQDIFDITQDGKKKKKKKSFLKKVSKLGRTQSNPVENRARSSDSDDKVQPFTTDNSSNLGIWGSSYIKLSPSRTAAKSMDDLSAIPESNTNNNNITEHPPPQSNPSARVWGFRKLKEKKSHTSLHVEEPQVIIKSAPSTPEKQRKKHASMPNFNANAHPKRVVNQSITIAENDQGVIPECTVKRRSSDAAKHQQYQERHRSLGQEDLKVLVSNASGTVRASSNVVRASSLTYGDKPNPYAARYRQHSATSPLGSQPSFLSSSTIDSQDSLNIVCQ